MVPDFYPRVRFGRFGNGVADEVIFIIRNLHDVEIHCHGGRQVIAWILNAVRADGVDEVTWTELASQRNSLILKRPALHFLSLVLCRNGFSILLDQAHGAYARAVEEKRELVKFFGKTPAWDAI